MDNQNTSEASDLLGLTADIVASYVSNNSVAATDLAGLIANVHAALRGRAAGETTPVVEPLKPAVPVKKSITPDYIICLDDGRQFKSLKRHLRTAYDMTPAQYREKWSLPADYPMVAPNYAAARSNLAKTIGLGRKASIVKAKAATPVRRKSRKAKAA